MNNVSQLTANDERKEKRRLHLREVAEGENMEASKEVSNASAGESVGATLRAARLARGEDPASIGAALKMRADQLEAIEENDFSRLPGRTYAMGFVRAYARYLDLDTDALIQRYKDESASQDMNKPVELVFPKAVEEQNLPNGSILIVALIIAMVIYGVSYLTMPNRKTPSATAKADDAPVVVVQPAPAAPPVMTQAPVLPALATPAPAGMPFGTFVAGTTDLSALPAAAAPVATTQAMLDAPLLSSTSEQVSGISDASSRITLKAIEPTYLRVRDMKQQGAVGVLVDRILKPGESFRPPDRAGLLMQTGNAGGLQVEVDGRMVGVLGRSGEVITRIPVDPAYFLERLAESR